MTDILGQVIGDCRIEGLVGEGAIGQVYRARNKDIGRLQAIKLIHLALSQEPGFRARFEQELRPIIALVHPHIVTIYDSGEYNDRLYLRTELFLDGSLQSMIAEAARTSQVTPLDLGIDLIRQVADALAFAHSKGVFHHDIKPSNLFLEQQPSTVGQQRMTLKIGDFGLARMTEGSTLSTSGALITTPAYMSPEQYQRGSLDGRSDIYSLGVVFYEVMTGRLPFETRTPYEAADKHINAVPPRPRAARVDLPDAVEAIILRCLAKRPEDRYATAADLADALRDVLKTLAVTPRHQVPSPTLPQVQVQDTLRNRTRTFELSAAGLAIGRLETNDVAIDDNTVARNHLRIDWDGQQATVTDLGTRNGTYLNGTRLPAQVAQPWRVGQQLQVGATMFRLEPGGAALPAAEAPAVSDPAHLEVTLAPEHESLNLTPADEPTLVDVTVTNHGRATDTVSLMVEEFPADWVVQSNRELTLEPGQREVVRLAITVPRVAESRAGEYPVLVRARSRQNPAVFGVAQARWTVLPFSASSLELLPALARERTQATYTVRIGNGGNLPTRYTLSVQDTEHALVYTLPRSQILVEPGQTIEERLTVQTGLRWVGGEQRYNFVVRAATHAEAPEVTGHFVQIAGIQTGLLTALGMLMVLVLLCGLGTLPATFFGTVPGYGVLNPTSPPEPDRRATELAQAQNALADVASLRGESSALRATLDAAPNDGTVRVILESTMAALQTAEQRAQEIAAAAQTNVSVATPTSAPPTATPTSAPPTATPENAQPQAPVSAVVEDPSSVPEPTEAATSTPTEVPTNTPTATPVPLEVTIEVPAEGATITKRSDTNFSVIASDPATGSDNGAGIRSVTFSFSGQTPIQGSTDTTDPYCAFGDTGNACATIDSAIFRNLANGDYTMTALATADDDRTASILVNFSIQRPALVVNIERPAEGAIIAKLSDTDFKISAYDPAIGTGSGAGIAGVEFVFSGPTAIRVESDTAAPYCPFGQEDNDSCSSMSSPIFDSLSNGRYTLAVVVTDSNGRVFSTAATNFNVQKPAIDIIFKNIPTESINNRTQTNFLVEVNDHSSESEVASVSFHFSGPSTISVPPDSEAPYCPFGDINNTTCKEMDNSIFNNLVNGQYTITAVATTDDGRSGTETQPFSIDANLVVTINATSTITNINQTNFSVIAYDPEKQGEGNEGIAQVAFIFEGPVPISAGPHNSAPYCPFIENNTCKPMHKSKFNRLVDGDYTITAFVTADDGRTKSVTKPFTIAKAPLHVEIDMPPQTITSESQIKLRVTAYDTALATTNNGEGIEQVDILFTDDMDNKNDHLPAYNSNDGSKPYCPFGQSGSNCNSIAQSDFNSMKGKGPYTMTVTVTAIDGRTATDATSRTSVTFTIP